MHCLYFCFLHPAGVRRLWPWNQEDRCNISANYCFHIIQIRQFRLKRILIADPFFLSLAPSRVIFAVSIMLCDKEMPLRHDFGFMHVGKCLFQIFGTILTIVHRNVNILIEYLVESRLSNWKPSHLCADLAPIDILANVLANVAALLLLHWRTCGQHLLQTHLEKNIFKQVLISPLTVT